MDYYLNQDNSKQRLLKEWMKYNELIIAYDFDNTVFDYHGEGHNYNMVIDLLRKCRDVGAKFIVFTSKSESEYDFIKAYLVANDIPFDKINEDIIEKFNGRKVYYNILLDDRAGLRDSFEQLSYACDVMRYFPSNYNKPTG